MPSARSPLFVRLSAPLISQLEARIELDGRTKQAVVEDLLATQLSESPADAAHDVLDLDVLDLAATATLLRVTEADVLDRIAGGDFPARRFGSAWRISRSAVLTWLSGTDPISTRGTGFTA